MNVVLFVVENQAISQAVRAAMPEGDVLLVEASVEAARRRMVALKPDVIVLDDGPRLGLSALPGLRSAAPDAPLIALSSRGDHLSLAGFTRAGATEVLPKPFDCEQLVQSLHRAMVPAPLQTHQAPAHPGGSGRGALNQHQMALRWLSRVPVTSDDPVRLAESLVEASEDIFDAVRTAVLLEQEDSVRVVASHGLPGAIVAPLRLSYERGLMRWFDEHACLLDRSGDPLPQDVLKELQVLSARLAVPLLRDGRVCGAIVLGDKASGLNYSHEERELITLMARSVAIAFERARSVHEASTRHGNLSAVIEHAPMGLVTVRPDRTLSDMNGEAEQLLQVRLADMQGRSIQKVGSAFADVVLRAMQSGQALRQEKVLDSATGTRLTVSVAPVPGGGAVASFSALVSDTVATEEIAYSPFWEYLAGRVAQEIKNPMVAVNTYAQLLPRKHDSEDFRESFSRVVQKEVGRINHVVETLFEFARNPKLTLRRCNLRETVENVIKSVETELAAHSIRLETTWDPTASEADIDPQYFSQAVQNVVQNSIDAMPSGGVLHISTNHRENRTEISISDTGPGISGDGSQVFLPFYSTREKGMGLGLPIANRIMRQHHGDLELKDQEQGACFVLKLPQASGASNGEERS